MELVAAPLHTATQAEQGPAVGRTLSGRWRSQHCMSDLADQLCAPSVVFQQRLQGKQRFVKDVWFMSEMHVDK